MSGVPSAKLFVLDTNVILHDSTCLTQFKEHDIVLPITVLEELDRFKKGGDTVNFHAREFARDLDELSGDGLFNGGIRIGPGLGRVSVRLDSEFAEEVSSSFLADTPDHRILNCTFRLSREQPDRPVILVSKDVNLRMKAKAMGLPAQDYTSDRVPVSDLYTGRRVLTEVPEEILQALYSDAGEIPVDALAWDKPLYPNEYLILKSDRKSALAFHDPHAMRIRKIDKIAAYGITPRNAEQTFALHALLNPLVQLVTLSGKAGTGKTLLALAAALEERSSFPHTNVARPVVPLSNKDIGFLPGDIASKLDPYMQPLYDNLSVIQNRFPGHDKKNRHISEALTDGRLTLTALSYIRGRSLQKTFFIVDEAQNLTPHEVKTIITRAGEGTKMVFTGDIFQIDHPYLDSHANGLSHLIAKMRGQSLYAHVTLEKGERSDLAELASNLL